MASLCAVVWLLGIGVTSVSAGLLYDVDFSTLPEGPAVLPEWSLTEGNYSIEDGWLVVRSRQSNPVATLAVTHDGDGTFRAKVRNAAGCHWSGLMAKGVYLLEVNNEFARLALRRWVEGQWTVVAEVFWYTRWAHNTQEFELRLSFVGNRVYGFLDDKLLLQYDDPEPVPLGGHYGLMSGWNTDLAWRDISLSDEPDLSEWPYESLPPRAPEDLVQVTWVRCLSSDSILFDGETGGVRFRVTTGRPEPTDLLLRTRLLDVRGREVGKRTEPVRLSPGDEVELTAQFPAPARGCFKVALDAGTTEDDLAWVEDLGSFTVVPRELSERPANPDSYFGGHMDGINHAWHFRAGRKLGILWARCHDMLQQGWWTRIQPDGPDQWIWPYDEAQRDLDELGFTTLGEFLWTPTWASSANPDSPGDPNTYPPRSLDDFARFVQTTVLHYRGSIRHWEVWNEPMYGIFFRGTPEEYAAMLKTAYQAVKEVAPECTVIGGGGIDCRSRGWIRALLEAGAGPYMDVFSIHYLEPDLAAEFMPWLRKILDEHGMTGPVWNTEAAVATTSFLDQLRTDRLEPEARYHYRNACFELVRMYMENLANGVERVFYYEQCDPWRCQQFAKPRVVQPSVGGSMWDEGQMLKPIAAAHAALALVIEGKTFRTRLSRGEVQAFIFEGPEAATAVQYATFKSFAQKDRLRLKLPAGSEPSDLTVVDFMGNESPAASLNGALILPLSREPVYVVCTGTRAGDVLRQMYAGADPGQAE